MANGKPRAHTQAIVGTGSVSRAVVRFTCVSCLHELELANNDPRKHAAFFAQQARNRGWDTDGKTINRVFCPDCRKTPSHRTRRQAEMDSVVLPALEASEPPTIEGVAEPWVEGFPPSALKVLEDVVENDIVPLIEKASAMPREMTQEQRLQIRRMLDQYFDDKEGCYLVGDKGEAMSDQMIGQAAGVPWGEVTKIREAAYGKIMVDPALAPLRQQMTELEKHGAALADAHALFERKMGEMRAALDGYGRQRQVKAS